MPCGVDRPTLCPPAAARIAEVSTVFDCEVAPLPVRTNDGTMLMGMKTRKGKAAVLPTCSSKIRVQGSARGNTALSVVDWPVERATASSLNVERDWTAVSERYETVARSPRC